MKNIRRIAGTVCFFFVFAFLFLYVSDVLARKSLDKPWNMSVKVEGFFNEPEDSIDIMCFGSSHMYCSVDPVLLQEQTGLSAYVLATQEQPVWLSYYYMKEALKTQSPEVMVFEVNMVMQEEEYSEEGANYSAMDPIPFSLNKVSMSVAAAPWGERHNHLFNVFKYHDRWEELEYHRDVLLEYKSETDPLRGYVELTAVEPQEPPVDLSEVTQTQEPIGKVMDYLNKIIDLSDKEGFRLIFLKTPSNATPEEKMVYNSVEDLARERGVEFIDYNMHYDELGLDPGTDFYDSRHLNRAGADKFSISFGDYLVNHENIR